MMISLCWSLPHTLKVLCFQVCMCLAGWPLSSEAARLRCGTDLLSDLIFVCGDRGIYLGKGNWSGYGSRPRGKGIVDHCCQRTGCDLQHLEMYCAKSKKHGHQHTTAYPATATLNTLQQFQTVYQRRISEHLGAPNSSKRESYRKKTHQSPRRRNKVSSSRRRTITQQTTIRPPSTFENLHMITPLS